MEKNINYVFKDKNLFNIAFTHVSYANEHNLESNQRLEFLGDSVLSFIVAQQIYKKFPEFDEGELTKLRSNIVCEASLAKIAKKLKLDEILKIGNSEKHTNGQDKPSILADTFEALLGAIFLDGGIEAAEIWILKILNIEQYSIITDYKSKLQTFFQKKYRTTDTIEYKLISQEGQPHEPTFSIEVIVDGKSCGKGHGKSRRVAEQAAAQEAFDFLFGNSKEDNC